MRSGFRYRSDHAAKPAAVELRRGFTVTSINSLGTNQSLLWALQRQFAANAAKGTQSGSAATSSTSTSSASSSTSSSPNNGVTGSSSANVDPGLMSVFVAFQEQQSAPQGTGSQAGATGVSNMAQNLFDSIDTDGNGQISQSELENAVTSAGGTTVQADSLFNKISDGGSSVSESQLASALQQADGHHHHHHGGGADSAGGAGSSDPLMAALDGSSSANGVSTQVTVNPDGSTTTTLTYSDGTVVTETSPAASGGSAAGAGNANQSATGQSSTGQPGSGTTASADGSSTGASGTASTNAGGTAAQNQQNMEQMLSMLIKLQASMAQSPQVTTLAA